MKRLVARINNTDINWLSKGRLGLNLFAAKTFKESDLMVQGKSVFCDSIETARNWLLLRINYHDKRLL